jgi:hypothetical protein
MSRTRIMVGAAIAWSAFATLPAAAQTSCTNTSGSSCSLTNTASVTVGSLVSLDISGTTTSLTAPTSATLGTDVGPDAGPTFTIKANQGWALSLKSGNATNWTYAGAASGVKPISHLKWSLTSGGSYASITASDATLTSGSAGTNAGAAAVFFKTTYVSDFSAASNAPGSYSLPVVFTLIAQ